MRLLWLIVLALFIFACTKPIPLENGPGGIKINHTNERPNIPRSPINETEFVNEGEQPIGPAPIIIINKTPSVDLDVPLGQPLGKFHPVITEREFPLLHHSSVRVNNNFLLGYQERLRFDFGVNNSGRIVFSKDDDDNIGTFLYFTRDDPVFEYSLVLSQGTFEDVSGRDIQILGHTYTIAEATNSTVVLYGKDVPFSLIFSDNDSLRANGSTLGQTVSHVRPNTISYTLYGEGRSDDYLMLGPGESISDKIGRVMLASLIFDIRYLGAPLQNSTPIGLAKTKFGYKLHFQTAEGIQEIPLVEQDAGKLVLGKLNDHLHLTPCTNCIAPEELVLLTSPDGRSFILRYSGMSNESKLLIMRDLNGNRYDFKFVGNPGIDARTDIVLGGIHFPVSIGKIVNDTANITVEQGFRNGRAELVTLGGFIIRIGDPIGLTLPLQIVIPASKTRTQEERTDINISYNTSSNDWMIGVRNVTFIEDQNTTDSFGITDYGMGILLDKNKRNLPIDKGDEATFLVPQSQAYGTVRLEG